MSKKTLFFILILALAALLFAFGTEMFGPPAVPVEVSSEDVFIKNGATYNLVAGYVMKELNGKKIRMLAYNGSIPGPSIHVREGDEVTLHFINNTSLPTLLHAHGIRMDNQFDGSQLVQPDIMPSETFDYSLRFADPGIYWYHPHVREDKEQNMGLYGSFVVEPQDTSYWPAVDSEEVLFLSDLLIEDGGIAPYSDGYVTHALMGRFGNTLLANGEVYATFSARPGEVKRFLVINAATVRPFNFRIAGAQMKLVGGDNGRNEKETFVDTVMLQPSERAVLDVHFPSTGKYVLEHAIPDGKVYTIGAVEVNGENLESDADTNFMHLRTNEVEEKQFLELKKYLQSPPDKTLRLTLETDMAKIMSYQGGMASGGHEHGGNGGEEMGMTHDPVSIEWEDNMGAMNTFSTSDTVKWIVNDEATGKKNMDIVWKFKRGDIVKVRIVNDPTSMHPMQHPIHFHGNHFVILAVNDILNDNMVWKDTASLKTGDMVDILLEASNPGKWMAHCHIAEHLHSGMMFEYDVE